MKKFIILCCFAALLGSCINPNKVIPKELVDGYVVQYGDMELMLASKEKSNNIIYSDFQIQKIIYKDDYDRIKIYYDQAFRVKVISDSIMQEISFMKNGLVGKVMDIDTENALANLKVDDKKAWGNIYTSEDYFEVDSENGKATQLKNMISNYRKKLLSPEFLYEPRDSHEVNLYLPTNKPLEDFSWEELYFEDVPAISVLYQLTKWQYHIREAEHSMIDYFYNKLSASSYRFGLLKPKIIPKSYTVPLGSKFEAEIVIAAFSTTENPEIKINGQSISEFKDGSGIFRENATKIGKKKVRGSTYIRHYKTGETIEYPFETEYEVVPAN